MRRTLAAALRKTTVRVFGSPHGGGGGTTVTLFPGGEPWPVDEAERAALASTCTGSRAVVFVPPDDNAPMAVYAPHHRGARLPHWSTAAALAAAPLGREWTDAQGVRYQVVPTPQEHDEERDGTVALRLHHVPWSQAPLLHPMPVHRLLREHFGLSSSVHCTLPVQPVVVEEDGKEENEEVPKTTKMQVIPLPTFCHATWAQQSPPLTLVYLNSYAALCNLRCPSTLPPNVEPLAFYTSKQQRQPVGAPPIEDPQDAWECRLVAGDTDPGRVAALLALGLHGCARQLAVDNDTTTYCIVHHSSSKEVGKKHGPSHIWVDDIVFHEDDVVMDPTMHPTTSRSWQGRVSLTLSGYIQVEKDEEV